MGWTDWFKDPTGPGKVSEKITTESDGTRKTEYVRTEDNTKKGDKGDHSHIRVYEKPDGTKSAHAHGIRGGERKNK